MVADGAEVGRVKHDQRTRVTVRLVPPPGSTQGRGDDAPGPRWNELQQGSQVRFHRGCQASRWCGTASRRRREVALVALGVQRGMSAFASMQTEQTQHGLDRPLRPLPRERRDQWPVDGKTVAHAVHEVGAE